MQCNSKVEFTNENYWKIFFTSDNKLPGRFTGTRTEAETLKDICEEYFKLDYNWLVKTLADFRIYKNNHEMVAEAVYIINVPEIIGMKKKGKLLSFKEINNQNIKVDSFYERIFTQSGRQMFR